MELPETFWQAIKLVGGFALIILGCSFAVKFVQAAFVGKVAYWSGLEKFGFLFSPITLFISPLLIHLPFDPKKSLIRVRQQLWVHLFFGPVFFMLSLMFVTAGVDMMGMPGATTLNTVLTLNNPSVPPVILYAPPFQYRFPFLKKATRTVFRALTTRIPEDKKNSYNAYERQGHDVENYTKHEHNDWLDEDEPVVAAPPRK